MVTKIGMFAFYSVFLNAPLRMGLEFLLDLVLTAVITIVETVKLVNSR